MRLEMNLQKVILVFTVFAILTSCASSSGLTDENKVVDTTADVIVKTQAEQLKEKLEILKIQHEIADFEARKVHEAEKARLEMDFIIDSLSKRNRTIKLPGLAEAIKIEKDSMSKIMTGYGYAQAQGDIGVGFQIAQGRAISDLTGRFIGTVITGLKSYANNTHLSDNQRKDMARIQNIVFTAGKTAIGKFSKRYNAGSQHGDIGGYDLYYIVGIDVDTALEDLKKQLAEQEVDINSNVLLSEVKKVINEEKEPHIEKIEGVTQGNQL